MDQITRAFDVLLGWVIAFGAACMGVVFQVERFLRARMTELGWSANLQTVVLVASAVLLVLVLLRVFAPLLRILLILFLLVLALQFLHPETWRRTHAALPCPGPCTTAS